MAYLRQEFLDHMEAELKANEHKGDWDTWKPDKATINKEIEYHSWKLMVALLHDQADAITEYAADVANLCMKTDELFGVQVVNGQSVVDKIVSPENIVSVGPTVHIDDSGAKVLQEQTEVDLTAGVKVYWSHYMQAYCAEREGVNLGVGLGSTKGDAVRGLMIYIQEREAEGLPLHSPPGVVPFATCVIAYGDGAIYC